jgi:hypothetical protein
MTVLLGNELLKLRTIRSPWLLLAAAQGIIVAGISAMMTGADPNQATTTSMALGTPAGMVSLFTLVLGITAVAGEYRQRTITSTYLATPGQQHERKPPLRVPVPAHPKPPVARQPRQRPLDPPPVPAQPGRGLYPTPRDPRGDPTPAQVRPVGRMVVGLVGVDLAGPAAPPSRPRARRAHRGHVVRQCLEQQGVVDVGSRHRRGQRQAVPLADQVNLGSGLATIDGICADVVPPVWRARWRSPRWRATSPAGRPARGGRGPQGGAGRTRRRWPTGPGAPGGGCRAAAELLGGQEGPGGGGAGHEHQRGQAVAVGDGAVPAAVGWAGWGWQQGFDERPQVVGDELLNEAGHGADHAISHQGSETTS